MNKIKTIFMGTPEFAVKVLEALADDPAIEVAGVVTQPDRPVGRRQVLTAPPVKVFAQGKGVTIYQPEKISNIQYPISNIDLIIVAAYSRILPKTILEAPRFGCLNVHASLLPKYRGASCVAAAIRDGEAKTGVTIMKMDEGLDTGDILKQAEIPIAADDTAGTLTIKLAKLGAEMIVPTVKDLVAGKLNPQPQDNALASYAPVLKKPDGRIDWTKSAAEVERFIRAMSPWPGAWTRTGIRNPFGQAQDGQESGIRVLKTQSKPIKYKNAAPGTFFVHDKQLAVQCADAALTIERIQPEGKKAMSGEEFARGYLIKSTRTCGNAGALIPML